MDGTEIAIIGMAGRFPKAHSVREFWQNLRDGAEGITFYSDGELGALGVDPALLCDPHYVKAAALLPDAELFDASFFGINPREAEIMDPQHRVFLECSWEALESAGYNPDTYNGSIGVYAGGEAINTYLLFNLLSHPDILNSLDYLQTTIGNAGDFLTTRVSYKLNLKGPSHLVQSACSTSLVAVHIACQALLHGECDMALAGGVSHSVMHRTGYRYLVGGMASPDGHCRAFDARAQGTIFGSGVGLVVLKKLADALADGDQIEAVIKGSAINNDGSLKVGYTAPSVDGQEEVIIEALANAGVDADTINYIEAHGTGTPLGDPVEVLALTRAFRAGTDRTRFCALGSVKTNIGHLAAAAGVAGLIKTVLALKHKLLPPSLHFEQSNPNIDFERSPFYVNAALADWVTNGLPRRAGVSSFGVGGTNAHVILEEAPTVMTAADSRPFQLLLLSAKTEAALEAATSNLSAHLKHDANLNLADLAYTLQVGRKAFTHRRALVCRNLKEAMSALESENPRSRTSNFLEGGEPPVVFMFPGQGTQYVQMAGELYRHEPTFHAEVNRCSHLLKPYLGIELIKVLYPEAGRDEDATLQLNETCLSQPALFAIEYALAKLWMQWGVQPAAMIGHSLGEYVAACLAGVFTLEEGLHLVARRGRLMQQMPAGAMLAVGLPEAEVRLLLSETLSLAAVNGPRLCVVSGENEVVAELSRSLTNKGVTCRRLQTSHAFHSRMMDPILEPFTELVGKINLRSPQLPFISNVTGTWISVEQATDPVYWSAHLRQTVRFADGLSECLRETGRILLEVGPGQTLSHLARRQPGPEAAKLVLSSGRQREDQQPDTEILLTTLGKLWMSGVSINWTQFSAHECRRRVALPTYPFERQRYWVEPVEKANGNVPHLASTGGRPDIADWFYTLSWKRSVRPRVLDPGKLSKERHCWLLLLDGLGVGERIAQRLEREHQDVIRVVTGEQFRHDGEGLYAINPGSRADYELLARELEAAGKVPTMTVHLWSLLNGPSRVLTTKSFNRAQQLGYYSLLFLVQAFTKQHRSRALKIEVVTNRLHEVHGDEDVCVEKVTLLGLCKVIPQEYPNVTCQNIDIVVPAQGLRREAKLVECLLAEFVSAGSAPVVAYRREHRWTQSLEPVRLEADRGSSSPLRENGVYLIVGGLSGTGFALAEYLQRSVRAKLVIVEEVGFPHRDQWRDWLNRDAEGDLIARKISRAQTLEEQGAKVSIVSADLTNKRAMRAVINSTLEQFGELHGVIYAAGVVREKVFRTIQETGYVESDWHFESKLEGLLALEKALHDRPLDFSLLISSLSSVLGGAGGAAYSATHHFMDAFIHRHNRRSPTPWLSVNWDAWHFHEEQEQLPVFSKTLAMTAEEEGEAFQRLISSSTAGQFIVSTADLKKRIKEWTTLEEKQQQEEQRKEGFTSAALYPRPKLSNDWLAPNTELEISISHFWRQAFGIEQIGVHDNFFELGGDSLLATQLISRLRDEFQVALPLRCIFDAPTIVDLAAHVEAAQQRAQSDSPAPIPPILPITRGDEIPLSSAQQRLWFLDQLESGSPFYNIPAAVRLSGPLDVGALEQSLNEIIRRHESLRTAFPLLNGRPVQLITPTLKLTLEVTDLCTLPIAEEEPVTRELLTAEVQRPFDLAGGPLLRARLLRMSEDKHIFILTVHHIVFDGWSLGVLIGELTTLYDAFSTGRPSPLPELSIQYADFAHWQREWLQGDVSEIQLGYWKQQLSDLPMLQLPTDRPRPANQTFHGSRQPFALSAELTRGLNTLCQREGVTLFMLLLAAFQTLLYRYTLQDEIVVGSPIANRKRPETESLIGFFVNTLVLRTDFHGNPTFRELLRRVSEVALGAYAQQDLLFEKLVEALQPERDLSVNPLFQVMFIFQNAVRQPVILSGLKLQLLEVDAGTAKLDLTLDLMEDADHIGGHFEFNTDLFNAETIARMASHLERLLESIVADPDQSLTSLEILTKAEHRLLIEEWNDTRRAYPDALCLHHLFEAQAERTPDATAVIFNQEQLTYRELNRRANQLAHYLRARAVGAEQLVGICMERSVDMLVGLLGILKAGAAYVPLDPSYPRERVAYMLADARVKVLLTQEHLVQSLPADGLTQVICLASCAAALGIESAANPRVEIGTENLAYVIYTSGSTGLPKGVQIPHRAVVNFLASMRHEPGLSSRDVLLAVTSLSFDIAGLELFLPLAVGACSVIIPRAVAADGWQLWEQLEARAVTAMQATPATWRLLLEAGWEGRSSLKILCGGEALPRELANDLLDKGSCVWNLYGPTETTIWSAACKVQRSAETVSIGRPIANTEIYLLDHHRAPVPVGVPGELHIGGLGLARGYLAQPELTAEKFIPHPFSQSPGARLYMTGDLARYRPDGTIECLGRLDHQVKHKGFRIELGEIEAVLSRHPGVLESAVVARQDALGETRLIAYIVGSLSSPPTLAELRSCVNEALPEYMKPSTFVMMERLPLTPNGKVDRTALPAPDLSRPKLQAEFIPAGTRTETALAKIWKGVLELDEVGIHDNFFELGGDSILAIYMITRAQRDGLRLSPKDLFQHQTIAGLVTVVDQYGALDLDNNVEFETGAAPLQSIMGRGQIVETVDHAPTDFSDFNWNQSDLDMINAAISKSIGQD